MTTIEKKAVKPLVEHELALKVYLDSLLFEDFPADDEPVVVPLLQVVAPTPEIKPAEPLLQAEVSETTAVMPQPDTEPPEWAEGTFESLLFKVGGFLTLSVPLARLNGILPWPEKLTAVPGYAEWFLGLLPIRGRQVKIIDIAKFVIPENHKARSAVAGEARQFRHIILVDEGRFGLACDDLGDVIKLTKDEVRWRSDRTLRPWLAGTLIKQMCALIDIEKFVAMLKEGVPQDDITGEGKPYSNNE